VSTFDAGECGRRFVEFYQTVYGYDPFPWQKRVAVRVSNPEKSWPRVISLPTSAGKTACIDIAVFGLTWQAELAAPRPAPRRIFFVVDRRIVVDQAYLHATKLSAALAEAKSGILREMADTLRELADDERPLDVYALRGGIYRENTWVRSPLQPTIITSTVDQVGSRLLFRGYGVSPSMQPVHAGFVGNDALILLDEAHCSKPFAATARAVERYRQWGRSFAPFRFASLTATPTEENLSASDIEIDDKEDREHEVFKPRIEAPKPASLIIAEKARGKRWRVELVKALAKEARGLMGTTLCEADGPVLSIGVIVNRVATARDIAREFDDEEANVILLTGRMRPLDRDVILRRLTPLFSNSKEPLIRPTFVVATQCLEVGADLDFHALVTECASLDALRQRFGRLNRVAARRATKAAIVIQADQIADSSVDRVYGASLAETWKWLSGKATGDIVDFGVLALRNLSVGEDLTSLNSPSVNAPILLPSHLDCWVQTAPRPAPDPDPALFLHGPQSGPPDVQVVFRADLGEISEQWAEIVARCPPSSSEAMPVRIGDFCRWLAGQGLSEETGDVEGEPASASEDTPQRRALRWRGHNDAVVIRARSEVLPAATYIVPIPKDISDVLTLGDFPPEAITAGLPLDYGDTAFQRSRDRALLRLTPRVIAQWPQACRIAAIDELAKLVGMPEDCEELDARVDEALLALHELVPTGEQWSWLATAATVLSEPKQRLIEPHPLGGLVLTGKRRLCRFDPTFADDESVESPQRRQVTLNDHTRGVMNFAARFAAGCGLSADLANRIALAARWHDLGKADARFQAMLRGCTPQTAARRELLAKSGKAPGTKREREEARKVHRYPLGGRHELLSVGFALARTDDDLILHLIAAHHGECRPFAPPYADETVDAVRTICPRTVPLLGDSYSWPGQATDPCAANAIIPDRFWRVVRRYGWWGSAYLDSLFRMADHAASRTEQLAEWKADSSPVPPAATLPPPVASRAIREVELMGLNGSNPLAFLAAAGTMRLADQIFPEVVRMRWDRRETWIPLLTLPATTTDDIFLSELHRSMHRTANTQAEEVVEHKHKDYRAKLKAVGAAKKRVGDRKLRGAERVAALETEVEPLQREANHARANWLDALLAAAPAPFLSLGKALSVTVNEFRRFALRVVERLADTTAAGRQDADFAAAFGCDACYDLKSQRITPTEFQLITGSGHQFFLDTLRTLMGIVTVDQLRRSLWGPWRLDDPRLSFRWNPADDRRYAYAWGDPSDEEVRTEHGANLLAAFGLPLFPVVPTLAGATTTGFDSTAEPPAFTWPIWVMPRTTYEVRSLLSLEVLRSTAVDRETLSRYGVVDAYRVHKVEVGRPPLTKLNLTPAVAV
jgi:CRISPR-associated endonuclease/helicase Cas3